MNDAESKVLKKALKNQGELTGSEIDFIEHLNELSPGYPLKADKREKLYAIGKKVGIDGREEFRKMVLEQQKNK